MNSIETLQLSAVRSDPRWLAILSRNPRADGDFFYSVKTTGVYCRPSCGARPAKPENVQFHATWQEAERAGFRPCKRCKPNQPAPTKEHSRKIAAACRLIENSEQPPSLEALAGGAGLSAGHFHRLFKAATGLTPKQYAAAHRHKRLRESLEAGNSVTNAIYDAGYGSSGRFYEQSDRVLGMTPSRYRAGGAREEIRFAAGQSSLGSVLVAQSARGICAILLGGDPDALARDLEARFPQAELIPGGAAFEQLVSTVVTLVETPAVGLDLPLDIRGTAFQQRVWHALQQIPSGATASYSEIAQRIGSPKSVRAVAAACAANKLAVAVPCHRVVRSDGALSGYRWGTGRKRALLEREIGRHA